MFEYLIRVRLMCRKLIYTCVYICCVSRLFKDIWNEILDIIKRVNIACFWYVSEYMYIYGKLKHLSFLKYTLLNISTKMVKHSFDSRVVL